MRFVGIRWFFRAVFDQGNIYTGQGFVLLVFVEIVQLPLPAPYLVNQQHKQTLRPS